MRVSELLKSLINKELRDFFNGAEICAEQLTRSEMCLLVDTARNKTELAQIFAVLCPRASFCVRSQSLSWSDVKKHKADQTNQQKATDSAAPSGPALSDPAAVNVTNWKKSSETLDRKHS